MLHQSRAIRKGVSRLRRTGFDSPLVFYSFPDLEEDIRLYSCLAHGSADEFNRGEILFKNKVSPTPSTYCIFSFYTMFRFPGGHKEMSSTLADQ